jgi:hypothetical protein
MIHEDENGNSYYLSLDEIKDEGFTPIKVTSLLQFFTLRGKATNMVKENIIPIPELKYCVLAKHPEGDRYYTRDFRGYSLNQLYWYRRDETFSGEDTAIENLRRYTDDKRVILMLKPETVADISEMLKRLWRAEFKEDGQLPYKVFIPLLEANLKLEDYRDIGKNLTGYKTILNQMQLQIQELWKQAKEQRR